MNRESVTPHVCLQHCPAACKSPEPNGAGQRRRVVESFPSMLSPRPAGRCCKETCGAETRKVVTDGQSDAQGRAVRSGADAFDLAAQAEIRTRRTRSLSGFTDGYGEGSRAGAAICEAASARLGARRSVINLTCPGACFSSAGAQ